MGLPPIRSDRPIVEAPQSSDDANAVSFGDDTCKILSMTKTLFFTGGTSGLGRAAVMSLAAEGHHVLLAARNEALAQALIDDVARQHPESGGRLTFVRCDLASLSSVRNACEAVTRHYPQVDTIVNNAGLWSFDREETVDGLESTFQVNVVAPALIIDRLAPLLRTKGGGTIINTASGLHQGTIQFEDIGYAKSFSGFKAYRQSKLAIMLLTRLWAREFAADGIGVYSQHPGLVDTGLVRRGGWFARWFFRVFGRTPEKGAETLLWLIRAERETLKSGEFYADCKIKKATSTSEDLALAERVFGVVRAHL